MLPNPTTAFSRAGLLGSRARVLPLGTSVQSRWKGPQPAPTRPDAFFPTSSVSRATRAKPFPPRCGVVGGEGWPNWQRSEILRTKEKKSVFWPELQSSATESHETPHTFLKLCFRLQDWVKKKKNPGFPRLTRGPSSDPLSCCPTSHSERKPATLTSLPLEKSLGSLQPSSATLLPGCLTQNPSHVLPGAHGTATSSQGTHSHGGLPPPRPHQWAAFSRHPKA